MGETPAHQSLRAARSLDSGEFDSSIGSQDHRPRCGPLASHRSEGTSNARPDGDQPRAAISAGTARLTRPWRFPVPCPVRRELRRIGIRKLRARCKLRHFLANLIARQSYELTQKDLLNFSQTVGPRSASPRARSSTDVLSNTARHVFWRHLAGL